MATTKLMVEVSGRDSVVLRMINDKRVTVTVLFLRAISATVLSNGKNCSAHTYFTSMSRFGDDESWGYRTQGLASGTNLSRTNFCIRTRDLHSMVREGISLLGQLK